MPTLKTTSISRDNWSGISANSVKLVAGSTQYGHDQGTAQSIHIFFLGD